MEINELSKKKMIIISVLVVIIGYCIMAVITPMTYYTNDDYSIANYLSQAQLGTNYWYHQYINVILSIAIGGLYMILPGVEWWYVFLHLLMITGAVIVNYMIIKFTKSANCMKVFSLTLLFDVALFWFWFSEAAYTVSSCIFGIGCICIILMTCQKGKKWRRFGIATVGMFVVGLVRFRVVECLLCFFFLAVLIVLTEEVEKITARSVVFYLLYCAVTVLVFWSVFQISKDIKEQINGKDFIEFNKARIEYMDHGHDSYANNPEIYHAVGWDEDIATLAASWKFMPDEISAESFNYLTENSLNHVANKTIYQKAVTTYKDIINSQSMRILVICWIILTICCAITLRFHKKRYFVYWSLNNIGALILLSYITIELGRVNYRSLYVIFAPACVINLYIMHRCENKLINRYLFIGELILFSVVGLFNIKISHTTGQSRLGTEEKQIISKTYFAEHADNIYMRKFVEYQSQRTKGR